MDIIIDFTPDTAAGGEVIGRFSDILSLNAWEAETPVADWPARRARLIQLLNMNGDAQGVLSQADLKGNPDSQTTWGRIGLEEAIRKGVEEKFATIAKTQPGVKINVSKTTSSSNIINNTAC